MTLPLSGIMTAGMINVELGKAATAAGTLNDTDWRDLADVPSGVIRYSDFYGKTAGGGPPPPATDPMFAWVRLLAHLDYQAGGGNYFNNASGNTSAVMSLGANTGFRTDTPVKWGGVHYFNGATTTPGILTASPQASFDLNVTYWTMEMYYYEQAGSFGSLHSHRSGNTNGWALKTSAFMANINGAWSETQLSWAQPALDVFHHIALVKDGSNLRAYIDGTLVDSLGGVSTIQYEGGNANVLYGGSSYYNVPSNRFIGRVDDIRWTASATEPGAARYSADFTPPTGPFPDSA